MDEDGFAEKLFNFLDTKKAGVLGGRTIFPLFSSSGLSKKMLAKIWEVSAQGAKGLRPAQFELALRVISLAQQGVSMVDMKSKISNPKIPRPKLKYPANFSLAPKTPVVAKKPDAQPKPRGQSTASSTFPVKVTHAKTLVTKSKPRPLVTAAIQNSSENPALFPKPSRTTKNVPRNQTAGKLTLDEPTVEPSKSLPPVAPISIAPSPTQPTTVSTQHPSPNFRDTGKPALSASKPFPTSTPKALPDEEVKAEHERKAAVIEPNNKSIENDSKTSDVLNRKELIKVDTDSQNLMRATVQLQQQSAILKKNAELENVVVKLRAESKESNDRIKTLTQENKELKDRFATNANMVSELTQKNTEWQESNTDLQRRFDEETKRTETLQQDLRKVKAFRAGLNKRFDANVKLIIGLTQQNLEYSKTNRELQERFNTVMRQAFENDKRELKSRSKMSKPSDDGNTGGDSPSLSFFSPGIKFENELLLPGDSRRSSGVLTDVADVLPAIEADLSILNTPDCEKSVDSRLLSKTQLLARLRSNDSLYGNQSFNFGPSESISGLGPTESISVLGPADSISVLGPAETISVLGPAESMMGNNSDDGSIVPSDLFKTRSARNNYRNFKRASRTESSNQSEELFLMGTKAQDLTFDEPGLGEDPEYASVLRAALLQGSIFEGMSFRPSAADKLEQSLTGRLSDTFDDFDFSIGASNQRNEPRGLFGRDVSLKK